MGQGLSCGKSPENVLFSAVQVGDLETVEALLERESNLLHHRTVYDRHSALHIAAAYGQIEILAMLLEKSVNPDVVNRRKQTPLMLAAMHGNISCVKKLIEDGANILKFDSIHGRTCLHYAAYYGHSGCLKAILSAAQSSPVAVSWGYARFVNIRDAKGATPLHLAARQRRSECVHILLDNGALVCASTSGYVCPGSTPLHLAARGGSLDCVRKLLAWGADRLQRDAAGRIPYVVALKQRHGACAALLNPSSAEPIVWPAPLKFISELNEEAKTLLEQALMEANREREKSILKGTTYIIVSPSHSDSGLDDIISEPNPVHNSPVFVQRVFPVGHGNPFWYNPKIYRLAARLVIPNYAAYASNKSAQLKLKIAVTRCVHNAHWPCHHRPIGGSQGKESREGSSSFKSLSAVGSFSKIGGLGSGRVAAENEWVDKP
ncbi:E3 ubiquitin-protein ligase XB3 [Hibiscus syriacus]|uniref:E3 ubiquitin-protein ligase XB3 n=1 Tax=Hibiscus syriacus TaxID=106335 RepID=A0A6A2XSC7_HIBSY|nr:E3 ubiquitin-protein ligase XB3 [Hibiscus syriacus]